MKSTLKNKSFNNEEIKLAESLILSSIISKYEGINGNNLNYLPVLENKFSNRIFEEKNKLDSSYPKIVLEPFPLRNYFQIGLFFKLFLLFILFGFNIKGYSFSIFIAFLIIYYWYYVNADIQNYYDTKIQELKFDKLNDQELGKLLELENIFNEKKDAKDTLNDKDKSASNRKDKIDENDNCNNLNYNNLHNLNKDNLTDNLIYNSNIE